MESKVERISPELAKKYLEKNTVNRPLSGNVVKNYAADMKAGRWELTEQGISFYENGFLADGQHRLVAIVRSGVTVEMYVTRNVPDSSFVRDRGRGRTIANIMGMKGSGGDISHLEVGAANYLLSASSGDRVSDTVVCAFLRDESKLLHTARLIVIHGAAGSVCKKAPVIAAAYVAMRSGMQKETVKAFLDVANTGLYSSKDETAAQIFRNYLLKPAPLNTRQQRDVFFNMCLCAMQDYAAQRPRTKTYKVDIKSPLWEPIKKEIAEKYIKSSED